MSTPTPMLKRPPIERITFISAEGNPHYYQVGMNATEIRETEEGGEYCMIPWLEVFDGENLVARLSQHKAEHILYRRTA